MKQGWLWLMAAWGVALAATLGALFIGEVMGMTPCLLCWYQRIFMFPLALILGMAAFAEDRRGAGVRVAAGLGWCRHRGLPHRSDRRVGAPVVGALRRRPFVQRTEPGDPERHPDSLVVSSGLHRHRLPAFCLFEKDPFMNAKKFTVIGLVAIVALFFYLGMNAYHIACAERAGGAGQGRADPPGAHALASVRPAKRTCHHRRVL